MFYHHALLLIDESMRICHYFLLIEFAFLLQPADMLSPNFWIAFLRKSLIYDFDPYPQASDLLHELQVEILCILSYSYFLSPNRSSRIFSFSLSLSLSPSSFPSPYSSSSSSSSPLPPSLPPSIHPSILPPTDFSPVNARMRARGRRRKTHRRSASNNAFVLGFRSFGSASCFPDGGGADFLDR